MALRKETNGSQFQFFRVLDSQDSINRFVIGLSQISKTLADKPLSEKARHLVTCFITDYQTAYQQLRTEHCRLEFREAFKHHKEIITDIVENIISACNLNSTLDIEYSELHSRIKVYIDGELLNDTLVKPRSFKKLYKFTKVMIQEVTTASDLIAAGRIITTVCSLVNDIRLTDDEFDHQMERDIEKLSSTPTMTTPEDYNSQKLIPGNYCYELYQTIQIIAKLLSDNTPIRDCPLWASEFVYAIRKGVSKVSPVYDLNKVKYSSASSGTKLVSPKRCTTIPGCLASIYEEDTYHDHPIIVAFDSITNFNLTYRVDNYDLAKTKSKERNSVAIEQKKPKARLIHTLSNPSQDRLTYFECIDKEILREVKSDCLFDQKRGPRFIKSAMKVKDDIAIYSLDMTDATNTMLLAFQKDCKHMILNYMFKDEPDKADKLCEAWQFLMKQETSFRFNSGHSIKYTMSAGQPMGYSDSFASFSIGHHIILLTLMRILDTTIGSKIYRILGDDLVIAIEDEKVEVPHLYSQLCYACNVECNPNKGYLYNRKWEGHNKPIAEFAKYLIMDSFDLTPVPVKLVTYRQERELVGLLCWLSEHNHQMLSEDKLFSALRDNGYTDDVINLYKLRIRYPVRNILSDSFRCKKIPLDYIYDKYDIIFLVNYVRDSLNIALMNMYYRDKSIVHNDSFFKFKGLKKVGKDIKGLLSDNKLGNNKLAILLDYLKLLSLATSLSLSDIMYVGDIQSLTEDEKEAYMIPFVKYLSEFDPTGESITQVMLMIESEFSILQDCLEDDFKDLAGFIMQLSSVRSSTLQRTWSGYSLRVASQSGEEFLDSYLVPKEKECIMDGLPRRMVNYLTEKIDNVLLSSDYEFDRVAFDNKEPFVALEKEEEDELLDFDLSSLFN